MALLWLLHLSQQKVPVDFKLLKREIILGGPDLIRRAHKKRLKNSKTDIQLLVMCGQLMVQKEGHVA